MRVYEEIASLHRPRRKRK